VQIRAPLPKNPRKRLCILHVSRKSQRKVAAPAFARKEVEEGIWLGSFMDDDLGHVDLEERTLSAQNCNPCLRYVLFLCVRVGPGKSNLSPHPAHNSCRLTDVFLALGVAYLATNGFKVRGFIRTSSPRPASSKLMRCNRSSRASCRLRPLAQSYSRGKYGQFSPSGQRPIARPSS
jgi:hypothetical protein